MAEARVRMVGLLALDDEAGEAFYDDRVAAKAAEIGMHVGAMTPDRFAHWLSEIMQ